jgi:hypothetical protein
VPEREVLKGYRIIAIILHVKTNKGQQVSCKKPSAWYLVDFFKGLKYGKI